MSANLGRIRTCKLGSPGALALLVLGVWGALIETITGDDTL
jgi:hypothetical protein